MIATCSTCWFASADDADHCGECGCCPPPIRLRVFRTSTGWWAYEVTQTTGGHRHGWGVSRTWAEAMLAGTDSLRSAYEADLPIQPPHTVSRA